MVQVKMVCSHVTTDETQTQKVTLRAVTGETEENKSWAKFTPAATLEMFINNPQALGVFKPGAEYVGSFVAVV